MSLTERLVTIGLAAGAVAVGVCRAETFAPERMALLAAVASGRSGRLHFTYADPDTATDVRRTFPWARSLVVVAVDYSTVAPSPAPRGAIVARAATADHYRLLDGPLGAIQEVLAAAGQRAERIADDSRFVDRAAALRAGIGWRGRSTMVLTPGPGPWTLLGAVVTDADLDPTARMARDCRRCTACLPACPTGALDGEHLDARRCIAAWLQSPGVIPHWIRLAIGRRIYGCDECLVSCPPGRPALRAAGATTLEIPFADLLAATDAELLERFPWWYVPRRDARHLRRNALIAAGNSREPEAVPGIIGHLDHPSSVIRGHAAWALARSLGRGAVPHLERRLAVETVVEAREEVLLALLMVEEPKRYSALVTPDPADPAPIYSGAMAAKREPVTPAVRAIRAAGIVHVPHVFDYDRHPGAKGAAEAIGVDLHLTVKTIVFATSDGDGVLALMNGDREVSEKKLARLMDVKYVKPAAADQARKWTGYEFGGTSPFGTRTTLPVFCHEEVAELDRIYINAGSRGFLVEMATSDLLQILQPTVADIAS